MSFELNNEKILLELKKKNLIVSWFFFEIISSTLIIDYDNENNNDNNDDNNDNNDNNINKIILNKKFSKKLIQFIKYDKNIVNEYKRKDNTPLSKEYFKKLGDNLLKDEKIKTCNFKTFPIFVFNNLVIMGMLFINNKIVKRKNYNIQYKKIFLVDIDKTITRFNNINIIKGIINSNINNEYLNDKIIFKNKLENILNDNLTIEYTLLYLLKIIQNYSWIFEFKI